MPWNTIVENAFHDVTLIFMVHPTINLTWNGKQEFKLHFNFVKYHGSWDYLTTSFPWDKRPFVCGKIKTSANEVFLDFHLPCDKQHVRQ
jgi:hypothetical protein